MVCFRCGRSRSRVSPGLRRARCTEVLIRASMNSPVIPDMCFHESRRIATAPVPLVHNGLVSHRHDGLYDTMLPAT